MSEAENIINDAFYIKDIFVHINHKWPMLNSFIKEEDSRTQRYYRNHLVNLIGYDGVNTFDGIIKHIEKNEHMIEWWIL